MFTVPTRSMESDFPHQSQLCKFDHQCTNQVAAHAQMSVTDPVKRFDDKMRKRLQGLVTVISLKRNASNIASNYRI